MSSENDLCGNSSQVVFINIKKPEEQ